MLLGMHHSFAAISTTIAKLNDCGMSCAQTEKGQLSVPVILCKLMPTIVDDAAMTVMKIADTEITKLRFRLYMAYNRN